MLQVKVVGPEGKDATKTMLQRVRKRREGVPQPFPFEGFMTFQPLIFQPQYFNPNISTPIFQPQKFSAEASIFTFSTPRGLFFLF